VWSNRTSWYTLDHGECETNLLPPASIPDSRVSGFSAARRDAVYISVHTNTRACTHAIECMGATWVILCGKGLLSWSCFAVCLIRADWFLTMILENHMVKTIVTWINTINTNVHAYENSIHRIRADIHIQSWFRYSILKTNSAHNTVIRIKPEAWDWLNPGCLRVQSNPGPPGGDAWVSGNKEVVSFYSQKTFQHVSEHTETSSKDGFTALMQSTQRRSIISS